MRARPIGLFALVLCFAAAPASAAWQRATTKHFVIYADASDRALRDQAVELERLDAMLRFFHANDESPDAAFNRVTIYVVPNIDTIRRLSHDDGAAGFYVPRVTGSVAFTPRQTGPDGGPFSPRIVLNHEYAHHFLLGTYAVAYPAWFSEGYAEFVSTAMKKDGNYWLGGAANHRAYGLLEGGSFSARQLFDPPARMNDTQRDAFYGRGWLLTHYALFDPIRRKQLATFLDLYNRDVPALEAAQRTFGDLKTLDRDLGRYLTRARLPAMRLTPDQLGEPPVEMRPLSPGESAMIAYRIRSTAGVDAKTGSALYAQAAPVAARYPGDAIVQGWLAEMALDAGHYDAADAAADVALGVDPQSSQALRYKARVLMVRAAQASPPDTAMWTRARGYIIKANRAQNNDAAALTEFYESFLAQGIAPRESAKQGLYRAAALVPQDNNLRYTAARQQILDGDVENAKRSLRPLAANPHAGSNNPAARLLAALDAGTTGQAALDVVEKVGDEKSGVAGSR